MKMSSSGFSETKQFANP